MSKTNKSSSKFCNIFPMKLTNNKITHENVIQSRMSKTQITDQQITNAYIEDTSIKTNVQMVANTYKNISFNNLSEISSRIKTLLKNSSKIKRLYTDQSEVFSSVNSNYNTLKKIHLISKKNN